MIVGVVAGKGDRAVSLLAGHGQRTVRADGCDGPGLAVADRLACRSHQRAVIAACGHDIADVDVSTAGDRRESVGFEVSDGGPSGLYGTVVAST